MRQPRGRRPRHTPRGVHLDHGLLALRRSSLLDPSTPRRGTLPAERRDFGLHGRRPVHVHVAPRRLPQVPLQKGQK